jgi:hypothetical protein
MHNYSDGRLRAVNTVNKHFGVDNFQRLCGNLWWGGLLQKYISGPPDAFIKQRVAEHSGGGGPSLIVNNIEKIIHPIYPSYMRQHFHDFSPEAWIKLMYP